MFGSNAFGALAMDTGTTAAPAAGSQLREGEELDVDWIKLVKTNHEVYVRVNDKVDISALPNECCLLAVANHLDLLIVGGNSDFRIHRLSEVHHILESTTTKDAAPASTPVQTIALPARPVWIRLAAGGERLVVATAGAGVLLFKLTDVLNGNTSPYGSITSGIPDALLDVLPNPAAPSPSEPLWRYVILLAHEGLVILDIEDIKASAPLAGPFTAACWSVKGKQFVVGTPDGKLVQYTPEGAPKSELPSPPELDAGYYPTSVQWLENDLFFAGYKGKDTDPSEPLELFVIHRVKTAFTFTKFYDVNDSMGYSGRSASMRHFTSLKDWGSKTKHLAFLVSPIASEIGVLHGKPAEGKNVPDWEALILDETARAILPAAKAGVRDDDSSPLGIALDLTSTKPVIRGIVGGEELPDLPPAPRLLAYSHEGFIVSFDIRYPDAGPYPGMVAPATAPANSPTAVSAAPVTPAAASATMTPSFGGSAFGNSSTAFGQSSFGTVSSPPKAPAFGSSAFGTPASKPAFGSSAFGSTTPSSTPSAFGSTPTTSAFGSNTATSKPSAFGSSGGGSAFGSSAFGTSTGTSGSAFGQSAFGSPSKAAFGASAFGSTAPTASPAKASAFGQLSTPAAAPTFGQSSTPAAPAFGQSSAPAAPAFGQSSTPAASAFGQSSTPTGSAFGQSSTPGGSAFGQSAFGATALSGSAFGKSSASSASAFGSTSSPSAFGSAATSGSGFSAFSAKPTTNFSFGPKTDSDDKEVASPSAFGGGSAFGPSSAFGKSAFGSSPFGQKKPDAPAFGGFGQKPAETKDTAPSPSVETKPVFGGFGQKPETTGLFGKESNPFSALSDDKTPGKPEEEPKTITGDAFGLDSLTTAMTEKNVPGLADSPPSSPKGGKAHVPGLEDDSDNESPPTTTPAKPPASSAASFIKPATAFGSLTSSTGAFGASSATKKPSSFASPDKQVASPTAFGKPSFGQSSTPTATPAFGQATAFGQSSKPAFGHTTAFGSSPFGKPTTATATTTTTTTTIVGGGGFGGFAAKTESTSAFGATSGGGGFSAFASKETTSVFGSKDDKSVFGAKESKSLFGPQNDKAVDEPVSASAFVTNTDKPADSIFTHKVEPKDKPNTTASTADNPSTIVSPPEDDQESETAGDDNGPEIMEASSADGEGQEGEVEDNEAAEEDEDDYEDEDEDEENYDEEEDDEEYDEDDDASHSLHSISQPPDMDTIPEEESGSSASGSDDEEGQKPARSPTWFASDSPTTPSLLSRLGPPVDNAEPSTPSKPAATSDRSSLLSRMSPPTSTPATQRAPAFTLKHQPKTSSPLSTHSATVGEPSTPTDSPPASPPTETTRRPSLGGVGLGLATSPQFHFKNNDKKDDKKEGEAAEPKADGKEQQWMCGTCMLQNPDSAKEKCTVCEEPRPGAAARAAKPAAPPAPPAVPTGGFSFGSKPVAAPSVPSGGFSFGKTTPAPAGPSPPAAPFSFGTTAKVPSDKHADKPTGGADWTCGTCMLKNPESAKEKCTVCEEPRPAAEPAAAPKFTGPPAPPSGGFSFGGKPLGGAPTPSTDKPADKALDGKDWTCETCMLKNPDNAKEQCQVCEAPRPGAAAAPKAAAIAAPPAVPTGGFSFGGKATGPPAPPAGGFSFGGKAVVNPTSSNITSAPPTGLPTPPAGGFSFGKTTTTQPSFKALAKDAAQWTCSECMLQNPDSAKEQCTICEAPRPDAVPAEEKKAIAAPPAPPAGTFSFGGFGKPTPVLPAAPKTESGDNPVDKPAGFSFAGFGKPADKPAEKAADKPLEKAADKPADNPADKSSGGGFSFAGFGKPVTPVTAAPTVPAQRVEKVADKPVGGFSFAGFGSKPPPVPAVPAIPATSKPVDKPTGGFSFAGFGKPTAPVERTKTTTVPAAPRAVPTGSSSPLSSPMQAPPTTEAKTAPSSSLFGSRPAAPSTRGDTSPAPFGLAPSTTTPVKGYSLEPPAPPVKATSPSQPSVSTPTLSPAPLVSYTVPERPTVTASQTPPRQGTSMAATLEHLVADVTEELSSLDKTLDANKSYHSALARPDFAAPTVDNFNQHNALPFSTLDTVLKITEELGQELLAIRAEVQQSDITLSELQSRMLKTDMKAGQAEKFLKAQQEPSFERAMQIKELSPQQAADQVRLRKVVQMTEARLSELQAGIEGLKRRSDRRASRSAPQLPALERMQRTVRNIDVAIRDRQTTVDELTRRINGLRVARGVSVQPETRSHTRESTPTALHETPKHVAPMSSQNTILPISPSPRTPRVDRARTASVGAGDERASASAVSLKPTDEQRAQAQQCVAATARIKLPQPKSKTAGVTKVPRKNASAPGSLVAHASVARGPVILDAAPMPASLKGKLRASTSAPAAPPSGPETTSSAAAPVPGAFPSASTTDPGLSSSPGGSAPIPAGGGVGFSSTNTAGPATVPAADPAAVPGSFSPISTTGPPVSGGFSFGGIKLDLDPGMITSTPGARRSGSSANRQHGSAVKLNTTPTRAPAASPGTLFGAMVTPPKKDDQDAGKKPSGFFSFSGFGK